MNTPRWLVGLLLLGLNLHANETSAVPFRTVTYPEAARTAAAEHKLVFIDFYTTWCGPCKMLDRQTWTDATVGKQVGATTVPLRMDAEKEGLLLAKKYAIQAYPTVLLLKPDGTEVDRIVGFRPPADFLSAFKMSLAGKSAVTRAREAAEAARAADLEQQVKTRQNLAQTLMGSGKYAEALPEYLWLYDTGMKQAPGYSGGRLSFLTAELGRLAHVYPPAKEAVQERREKARTQMMENPGDRVPALEFAALSDALGDIQAVQSAFDALPRGDVRRAALGSRLFRQLVEAKRYQDALDGMPFDTILRMVEMGFRAPPGAPESMKRRLQEYRAKTVAVDVEVLAGAGDLSHAKVLRDRLLALDSSPETKQVLRDRLARAGHPELLDDVQVTKAPANLSSAGPAKGDGNTNL